MKASFKLRGWAQAAGPTICFLLLIVAGWVPPLWLTGSPLVEVVDAEPFQRIAQGDYAQATPSLLYTAFIGILYGIGVAIAAIAAPATAGVDPTTAIAAGVDPTTYTTTIVPGFEYGIVAFALVQSLILIFICAGVCSWLYVKGAPLGFCLALAVAIALFAPFSRLTVQPNEGVMVVACLLLLTLRLIGALGDNCAGLRRMPSVCVLLVLLSVLLFLDLLMALVVVPTLLALCLTPTRVKGRLGIYALVTVVLCAIPLLFVFPSLGWIDNPLTLLKTALFADSLADVSSLLAPTGIALLSAIVLTIGALVWVRVSRRPRYLLPFVPLLSFGVLCLISGLRYSGEIGLSIGAFILCLPLLILIPFMKEYSETKDALRQRFLALRTTIMDDEREQRGEKVCASLFEELRELDPGAGYIGLYMAQGSELALGPLAVRLGALGYRTAFPAMLSDSQMAFFTTLGVSDEALFTALLEDRPFDPVIGANFERLTQVEPSDLSALIVSGVAFDKDRYRLGRGTGRYDRYIVRLEKGVPIWGVGFSEQLAEAVPVEPHDQPLSGVIVG
jgi:5-formyltetrahydrofolate cyclo-ligase